MADFSYKQIGLELDLSNWDTVNENFSKIGSDATVLQRQINQLVVDGDSSPEAAQARVSSDGTAYDTLKVRLDTETDFLTEEVSIARNEQIYVARFNNESIPASKLAKATNADRIKLENLADEVLQAMAGTTPVNATPANGSVTTEKVADKSISTPKISQDLATSVSAIDSLTGDKRLFNTLYHGYKRIMDDTGAVAVSGVMMDYAGNPSSYDASIDQITVQKNASVGTYSEFVISNGDMLKARANGGLTFSFSTTSVTAKSGTPTIGADVVFEVYYVIGSTITKIYDKTVASPTIGATYITDEFVSASLIPAEAQSLRVYIRQGGAYIDSTIHIKNAYLQLGNTIGLGNLDKAGYQSKVSELLGVAPLKEEVSAIEKQFIQNTLTTERLSSELMTYKLENGVLTALAKVSGVTNSHPFVRFPEEFSELVFTHIRNEDWIYLGGDATKGTAICIGTPYNVRMVDLGPAQGDIVDVTVPSIALNARVHLKWSTDTLIARKDEGTGFVDWFTLNLASYPQLQHYKINKRFGAMTPDFPQDLMKDITSTTGEPSLADRVGELENNLLKKWQGEEWNAVGDSITEQGLYLPLVANELGLIVHNKGLSSSTMAINNSYLQNKSVVERVTGMNGNTAVANADLWTVFAGVNDWLYETPLGTMASTDQTTFYGALKAVVENVLQRPNYPKLILFTPLQSNRNGANNVGVTMQAYRQAIKDVGDYYSVPVLDLYGIGGFNPINLSRVAPDGVHPNDTGTNLYYPKIVNIIKAN